MGGIVIRKIIIALFLGLLITLGITGYAQSTYADLKNQVVRFHVVANSNSEEDQGVKIMVRDAVAEDFKEIFDCENKEAAMKNISENLTGIEECANRVLAEKGFPYKATAALGTIYFPTKDYEGFSFPAGKYDALSIKLGEGKGNNWWCVCYPSLCFGAVQEKNDCVELGLSQESADLITAKEGDNVRYQVKFKLIEIIHDWMK